VPGCTLAARWPRRHLYQCPPSPRPRHRLSQHPPTRQPPSPSPSPTRQPQPTSNLPERAQLLAALADAGVTEDDYRLIEKARRLVDQVNARLSARGATLAYAVTCSPVGPVQTRVVPDRLVLADA